MTRSGEDRGGGEARRLEADMTVGQPAVDHDRTGGHEHRHAADRVVGLAAADEDEGERDEGGDPDRPPPCSRLREEHPDHARGADREEQRSGEEPEERHDLGAVVGRVAADGLRHRELRPAIRRLPGEVGCPEREGNRDGRPRPGRADDVPAPGEDKSHRQAGAQEQERVLVLEADPGRDAQREPETPVGAGEELHQQPHDDRPGQQVGIGGGIKVARAQVAGEGCRDRRQDLGPSRAAEVARR